jgi:hypothetical protein
MSDERDLTPEQEAHVARLLADARVQDAVPPEVAARLDRVLDGLAGEPVAGPPPAPAIPVIDLAARRRRRVRNLLVAAAAVVVAGVGIGQLVGPTDSDDGADSATSGDGQVADQPQEEAAPADADGGSLDSLESLGKPARITARSFAAAVRRLQDRPGLRSDYGDGVTRDQDLAEAETAFSCDAADYGPGKLIAVRYNGSPAVLAYRPPAGDAQIVELLQCGTAAVVRSTTLPLP